MSRSKRKSLFSANTLCRSERLDKKIWHRRWRVHERSSLATTLHFDNLDSYLPIHERQISNVWLMGKDGRNYWSEPRRIVAAERIAARKGQSPQERSALKQRLLRKWVGK